MAQFIAILRRNYGRFGEAHFTADLLDAEAEQARTLHAEGTFRQMWGHTSPAGAVVLLEANSPDAARTALGTLPLVQRDMLEVDLIPVGPYRGFAPRGAPEVQKT